MTTEQKITTYISKKANWSEELQLLRSLFNGTEAKETVKWGVPTYTIDGKNVAGLGAFKNYVGIWFFQGVFLKDSAGVLVNAQEGKTKALRQWRFTSLTEIKEHRKTIQQYISEAIKNQKDGKEIKPQRKKTIPIPAELKAYFAIHPEVEKAFRALTPSCQREYNEYIAEAKREATRLRRVDKTVALVMEGKGLNDKYKNC